MFPDNTSKLQTAVVLMSDHGPILRQEKPLHYPVFICIVYFIYVFILREKPRTFFVCRSRQSVFLFWLFSCRCFKKYHFVFIFQLQENQDEIENMMNAIFKGVFVHRYRYVNPCLTYTLCVDWEILISLETLQCSLLALRRPLVWNVCQHQYESM